MVKISERAKDLRQSGIRSASVKCAAVGGVNLGQGICDLPTPDSIKEAAYAAIDQNMSTYSACEGIFKLRESIATKITQFNRIDVNAEKEVVVTHGSTGAFVSAAMTLFNLGDEIILFEPFYGYHKNILQLQSLIIKSVPIQLPDFSIDMNQLEAAVGPKTRGIVICTPCNPCGKVFTEEELLSIGEIAKRHDLVVITDEIYEYITYPGHEHISFANLKDFKERTVTISGFSKTYNMTGWRLGYASGPEAIITKMALVQDLLYVCPATPLQHALLAAFELPQSYYENMREMYLKRRDNFVERLSNLGYQITVPQGAYYLMADFSKLGFADDQAAAEHLLHEAKVAVVTGRSFYMEPADGASSIRICYAINEEKLEEALVSIERMGQSKVA